MARLPPGPWLKPWHAIQFLRLPLGHVRTLRARYGDPFTAPTIWGPVVMTGEPEGLKQIFTNDPLGYEVLGKKLSMPLIGEHSLLMLEGERHRAERKLMQPPFHAQRMRAYGALMCEVAARHAAAWPTRPFDVLQSAREMSLEVIMRAVLGVGEPARQKIIADALLGIFEHLSFSFLLFPFLRSRFWPPWNRWQRTRARAAELISEEVAERRARPEGREDILSLLVESRYEDGSAMTDAQLLDEAVTLLQAGYETTAVSIAWAFYLIHRHPGVLSRLRDELALLGPSPDPAALAQHPYLDAVCSETLRIYPLVTAVARKLTRPMTLLGWQLPAGVTVGASMQLAHRRPEAFPDPDAFRPERFLERKPTQFEFVPFGGGTRRCLGAALAHYEMKLVVGTILATQRLELASEKPIREVLKVAFIGPGDPVELQRAA
jgi:cytochrome P450